MKRRSQQSAAHVKIPHEIWILVMAGFIIAIGYGLIAPIIPQFAASFGVGMAAAGAVVSIFAATRLIFAPVSGSLVDKLGSRTVYLSGLMLVALTTGLIALAQSYWQIMLLRGLAGFGSTMFTVSAMGLVIKLSPPQIRGRTSSAYASGFLFGNIFGPIIGSALSVLGFRWPFVIYGVALSVAGAIVWWRMPKKIGTPEKGERALPIMSFKEAIVQPAYRASLIASFANGWSNFGVRIATVPLFAAAIFSNGAAIAGFVLTAFAVGNAISIQFSGPLSDKIGRKPLILAGLIINGVFTTSIGFSHQFWFLIIASVFAGCGAGFFNPAQQAVLADIVGTKHTGGRVLANFQMAGDLGTMIGPIIVGLVAEHFGFATAFSLCGLITLTAVIAWSFSGETLVRRLSAQKGISLEKGREVS